LVGAIVGVGVLVGGRRVGVGVGVFVGGRGVGVGVFVGVLVGVGAMTKSYGTSINTYTDAPNRAPPLVARRQ
jgi:hypothetical protein